MNEVIKVLNERMSLRKYADKELSKEHLDAILECAMRAPTAGNMMMYSILVIRDKAKKEFLSKSCDNQPFIAKAPVILIFLADMQRQYDYFKYCNIESYCKKASVDFRSPEKSDLMLACSDALIAAQNAVMAAESLGIGSCYIGDIMENYEKHRELLKLKDYTFPIAMLALGYYEEGAKRTHTDRFKREYVVFEEEYRSLSDDEFKDMYEYKEKMLEKNNIYDKYEVENFGQFIYKRKTSADFSKEMARSVNEALKHWNGMNDEL